MIDKSKYDLFWGGYFSNWCPSEFVVDGITFNCGEQYMMYMKAMTFGDEKSAKKIMATPSPIEQKAYGRKVKNYDDKVWSEIRYETVKRGLLEKYKVEPFYSYLKERKDMIIVEASPYDAIWGIGYGEYDENLWVNMDKWGENLLGKCIMDIAKELFD